MNKAAQKHMMRNVILMQRANKLGKYIDELLSSNPSRINSWAYYPTKLLEFFLRVAIEEKNIKFMDMLIESGAPITTSILTAAIINDKVECLEVLLRHTTKAFNRNHHALHICALHKRPNSRHMCELLIKHNFELDIIRNEGLPLGSAIISGNIDVLETLLLYGAHVSPSCLLLAFSSSLSTSNLEKIIKFAVLQNSFTYKKLKLKGKFSKNFSVGRARPFMKYAQSCEAEVKILDGITLNSPKITLLDFAVSQTKQLKLFLDDVGVMDELFHTLSSFSLPIYQVEILRKLEKKNFINSLYKLSCWNCVINKSDKDIVLNADFFANICKYLSIGDLVSLWIAITNVIK